MGSAWLGFAGAVVVAVLTFAFGLLNMARNTRNQRAEELRRRRVDVYAGFCGSVIEYRRAQLHRWYKGQDLGSERVEHAAPEVAEDLRKSRAAAWSRFYEVAMICNDPELEALARRVMQTTRSMKHATTAEELDAISDDVHAQVAHFAREAGQTVLTDRQREAAPAPTAAPGS